MHKYVHRNPRAWFFVTATQSYMCSHMHVFSHARAHTLRTPPESRVQHLEGTEQLDHHKLNAQLLELQSKVHSCFILYMYVCVFICTEQLDHHKVNAQLLELQSKVDTCHHTSLYYTCMCVYECIYTTYAWSMKSYYTLLELQSTIHTYNHTLLYYTCMCVYVYVYILTYAWSMKSNYTRSWSCNLSTHLPS